MSPIRERGEVDPTGDGVSFEWKQQRPGPGPIKSRRMQSRGSRLGRSEQEGMANTALPGLVVAGAFVIILVVVMIASVEPDEEGLWGIVIGAGLGLVNLAVGYLVMRRALTRGTKTVLNAVVGGMIVRLFVVAGLIIVLQRTGAADPAAFGLTFLVFFYVYLGLEILLVERTPDGPGRSA